MDLRRAGGTAGKSSTQGQARGSGHGRRREPGSSLRQNVIVRGVFTSVSDLARKLRLHTNAYSANARPIRWKYSATTRRIRSNDFTATGHWLGFRRQRCKVAKAAVDNLALGGTKIVPASIWCPKEGLEPPRPVKICGF